MIQPISSIESFTSCRYTLSIAALAPVFVHDVYNLFKLLVSGLDNDDIVASENDAYAAAVRGTIRCLW